MHVVEVTIQAYAQHLLVNVHTYDRFGRSIEVTIRALKPGNYLLSSESRFGRSITLKLPTRLRISIYLATPLDSSG